MTLLRPPHPGCVRRAALEAVKQIVDLQAADEGCWFVAVTAPEAYLQQELRRLHAIVETLLAALNAEHAAHP